MLHFTVPELEIHQAMAGLRDAMLADAKRGHVRVANRLWGREGYDFFPSSRDDQQVLQGRFSVRENKTEAVRQDINALGQKQTEDKIKDLLAGGMLDPMSRLVLTNAIYFKGDWQHELVTEDT